MNISRYDFTSNVVAITARWDGIGRATAKLAVATGANVLEVGRDAERGAKARSELDGLGGRAHFLLVDVVDSRRFKRCWLQVLRCSVALIAGAMGSRGPRVAAGIPWCYSNDYMATCVDKPSSGD
jgi:NAD(P)-dependent dehydrogenase (short-subunit alcohol dehydrogenase family)